MFGLVASSSSSIFFSFTVFVASFSIVLLAVFYYTDSRNHKTPCPQSYPIIGNLIGFLSNRHRFHDWVTEQFADSPSLTIQVNGVLSTRGVCTVDPRNIEHLLSTNFHNFIKGSRFNDVVSELLGDGIFNADSHIWTSQRKSASYEFCTKSLRNFISDTVLGQIENSLVPKLSLAAENNVVVDLQEVLKGFTFDNICHVAFGYNTHSSDVISSRSSRFVMAFDDAAEITASRFLSPVSAMWKVKRFLSVGSEKVLKEAVKIIDDYAMQIIETKEKSANNNPDLDLLSRFMSSGSTTMEFGDDNERRKFLRDIIVSFMFAGKDTTSTALTWFFWLLCGHPRCEELILNEIIREKVSLSPRYDDLKKLNYLHAALSESLRLFPPVPINSKLTVNNDVLPNGTVVKRGWFADYSAYAMGRMERLWGSDATEFRPERWLDDAGAYKPFDQFRFPVFHCGPRICLGKEMAYVQMKSVVVALMSQFEILAVDGGGRRERIVEPPYTLSLLLKMRGGLLVNVKRRIKT